MPGATPLGRAAKANNDRLGPMKNTLLLTASLALLSAPLLATPQDSAPTNEQKYEKKIHKDFVKYGNWALDYDEVRKQAKEQNKLIFVYFSRSYSP